MANHESKWLRDGIEKDLVPPILKLGFSERTYSEESRSPQKLSKQIFPSVFQRVREDGIDQIQIQLEKYRRRSFRIDFGTMPMEGVEWYGRRISAITAFSVHSFELYYSLGGRSAFFPWYSAKTWPWRRPSELDYAHLTKRVAGHIPEIDLALLNNIRSPNVRVIDVRSVFDRKAGALVRK